MWNSLTTTMGCTLCLVWHALSAAGQELPQEERSDERQPPASIAQIAAGIAASRSHVESLRVEYSSTIERMDRADVRHEQTRFVFWGNCVLVDTQPLDRRQGQGGDQAERPRLFLNGDKQYKLWSGRRILQEAQLRSDEPLLLSQRYLDDLAWWPYDKNQMRPASEKWFFLPEALENNTYQVHEERETIDGAECVVVSGSAIGPGSLSDRLWLDPARGWALIKRISSVRPNHLRQDSQMIVALSDFREAAPGLWLPWTVTTTQCRRDRAGEFVPFVMETLQVSELAVNDIHSGEMFTPALVPGMIVTNLDTGLERIFAGREQIVESAAAGASTRHSKAAVASRSEQRQAWAWRLAVAVGSASLVVAGISVWSPLRRIASRNRRRPVRF